MHCGEVLLYPARKQHDADDDQPHKEGDTRDSMHDCRGVHPYELHPDTNRRRPRRNTPYRTAGPPLAMRRNPQRQPCYRETYLAGEPPEIGYDLC